MEIFLIVCINELNTNNNNNNANHFRMKRFKLGTTSVRYLSNLYEHKTVTLLSISISESETKKWKHQLNQLKQLTKGFANMSAPEIAQPVLGTEASAKTSSSSSIPNASTATTAPSTPERSMGTTATAVHTDTPAPTKDSSKRIFPAGDVVVTKVTTKENVPISSFYTASNKPTVVVFLRRWGCALCRGYAKDLNTNLVPLLRANNVGIEAVGVEWLGVEEFQQLNVFPNENLYVDDGKKAYKKLNLEYLGTIRGLANVLTASARKYSNYVSEKLGISGNLKGDGFQLGATYVLGQNGEIWFEHRQKDYGDHPEMETLVKTLKDNMPGFNEHPPGVAPHQKMDTPVCDTAPSANL